MRINAFKLPENISVGGEHQSKKKKRFSELSTNEWNTYHFIDYFNYEYQRKFNTASPFTRWDKKSVGAMRTLIKKNEDNKEVIKEKIKAYVEIEDFSPKLITSFCSNYIQAVLDTYLKTGKVPTINKKPVDAIEGIDTSIYDD